VGKIAKKQSEDKIVCFFVNSALKIQCHIVNRLLFRRFCPLGIIYILLSILLHNTNLYFHARSAYLPLATFSLAFFNKAIPFICLPLVELRLMFSLFAAPDYKIIYTVERRNIFQNLISCDIYI